MMLQPRRLVQGAEYPDSLARARAENQPRFESHLEALMYVARMTPMDSEPFMEPNKRVRETADPAHGYRVALFFEVDPTEFVTELKWVATGPLEADIDPWST